MQAHTQGSENNPMKSKSDNKSAIFNIRFLSPISIKNILANNDITNAVKKNTLLR